MAAAKPVHVVDDDLGVLKGIARLLSAHGLPVRTFSSAEEFLALADPSEASCLILDIHLGGLSGIELMQELRRSASKTPVVMITANDSEPIRRAAFASGCSAFLQKRVSAQALLGAVRDLAEAPQHLQ